MTDPLAPMPMTPEQVRDLVERTRAASRQLRLAALARAVVGRKAAVRYRKAVWK